VLGATLVGSLRREGNPQADIAAKITETASQTARHAKLIARELYPAEFEATGIVSAVTQLVNSKRLPHGPELTVEIQDGFFIHSSEKAIQLFRILQEAFNNALKHSLATRIKVSMSMNHEVIEIEVADNGTGIPRTEVPSQGMGLKILKYRANVINGKLRIKSDENGTVVSCRVAR
jgi:signal transduction histidine kinase